MEKPFFLIVLVEILFGKNLVETQHFQNAT